MTRILLLFVSLAVSACASTSPADGGMSSDGGSMRDGTSMLDAGPNDRDGSISDAGPQTPDADGADGGTDATLGTDVHDAGPPTIQTCVDLGLDCVHIGDLESSDLSSAEFAEEAQRIYEDGRHLFFPSGEYFVSEDTVYTSGVNLVGEDGTTFTTRDDASRFQMQIYAPGQSADLINIRFERVGLYVRGDYANHLDGLNIHGSAFINGETIAPSTAAYADGFRDLQLLLSYVSNGTIEHSTFSRGDEFLGRGIQLYKTHEIRIQNNSMSGYYMTNINITGQSEAHPSLIPDRSSNTQILDNSFRRTVGSYVEDHGIYAWGFYDMEIARNTFSGWSRSNCGYAIKARNGQIAAIHDNDIEDSGIIIYTYQENLPRWFQYVDIHNNRMGRRDITPHSTCTSSNELALYYWRNFSSSAQVEREIQIYSNTLEGELRIYEPANMSAFNIYDNN